MEPDNLRSVKDLGLKDVWNNEEHDFTPWLVEHIDQLASTIGIEIEDVERENTVGSYSADITGTEMNTDSTVVIENQYHSTDHSHLGQLLTYAAGTDAGFVIWIAEEFRDEHRSVLEWLNSNSSGDAKFFGIRPRVIQLDGTDESGFEFNTVIEPNDWERELIEPPSPRKQSYKDFFTELTEEYANRNQDWNRLKAQPQSWLAFGAGVSGLRFSWSFHQGPELSTELYIDTGDKERNEEIYSLLHEDEDEINEVLGDVVWQQLPDSRACRIKVARSIPQPIEELSAMQKRELIEWAVEQMDEIRRVFEPRLQKI